MLLLRQHFRLFTELNGSILGDLNRSTWRKMVPSLLAERRTAWQITIISHFGGDIAFKNVLSPLQTMGRLWSSVHLRAHSISPSVQSHAPVWGSWALGWFSKAKLLHQLLAFFIKKSYFLDCTWWGQGLIFWIWKDLQARAGVAEAVQHQDLHATGEDPSSVICDLNQFLKKFHLPTKKWTFSRRICNHSVTEDLC